MRAPAGVNDEGGGRAHACAEKDDERESDETERALKMSP
jgi:hypothetical protein